MIGAEAAFLEAVEQAPLRRSGRDRWSTRATFWTAMRFGVGELVSAVWPEPSGLWVALWQIAASESLAPIPGAADVEASPSVAAAEQGLAHMRAIVGERAKHVHR